MGLIAPLSGALAGSGQEMLAGARSFQRVHGDSVLGRPVQLFLKDSAGATPDAVRRMAQELLDEKHVSFLMGFADDADVFAVAPLAGASHVPMLVMGAQGADLTGRSRFVVRLSFTWAQVLAPLARWAAQNGIRSAYTLASGTAGGAHAEPAFRKACGDAGVLISGGERLAPEQRDFAGPLRHI
ncbi:MAG TPA: ABC transporter substrate-binding protein, partial [bacterium]|nr:ABC transporter substrate-binding protein [bacterium]